MQLLSDLIGLIKKTPKGGWFQGINEAPATQGESRLGAGASRLRAAGGDSTCAGRFTASQLGGRVAENQFNKEPPGVERMVRRTLNSHFSCASVAPESQKSLSINLF